jgi:hypothetical protein
MRGSAMKTGFCCACGTLGPLSFEHVPPEAAFNDRGVYLATLTDYFEDGRDRDPRTVRRKKQQRGMGRETLCERCNSNTGAWYGNAYVSWAYQGMLYRQKGPPGGSSLLLPFHIFPGRVAKQILCMFASAIGHEPFTSNPDLVRYVLNRTHRGIPTKYRIYCFLMALESTSSRQSPIAASISGLGTGAPVHVFSEISFPPFGYILAVDSPPIDSGLADITFFTESNATDWRDLHLRLPVRSVNSHFPGDFRARDEWEKITKRSDGSTS